MLGEWVFALKNVRYRDILAIDVLTIPPFKTTCIVGESGSGKTTLLKLLNHLLGCDSGEVLYKGENIKELDPIRLRREVVMLPQEPLLFPGTVRENLLLGLKFAEKAPADDGAMLAALARLRLEKRLEEDAGVLSGGEKQRLALCRVMLMQPEVLLLDEPTSALDEDTEELVMETLTGDAQKQGQTVVLITHSREVARRYGGLIVTLSGGKISGVEALNDHGG